MMDSSKFCCFLIVGFLLANLCSAAIVSHDERAIKIDGQRRVLLSGSIHYPRSTAKMWPDLIRKSKEGGLDAIETYVFWNAHEPARRQYDFTGNLDLVRFIKTIQEEGLYAVLRIGPYVCAEWDYGGFPMWLHNMPGIELRTANDVYMNEMQNFTQLIVDMMKNENLFASQGGPIILAQIENEYGNVMGPYGDAGKAYIDWCANMANSLDIGVPWLMCQQPNAPEPMLQTCNGWYCDNYKPDNPNTPKMWTENWTGWFKSWGGKDPHRTAEDLAFSVARFFQTGGTFQNYYMYHGGTNFGRSSGGPYITTSYDYDAPLDEFGNLNQPKWGHLKDLHQILHSMEYTLTHGNVSQIDLGNSLAATVYATDTVTGCFLSNTNTTSDATFTFQGNEFFVPAWSVSVLPDCKTEGYNTAKVNAQTTMIKKVPNKAESEPSSIKWKWRPENIDKAILLGKGPVHAPQLLDQKDAANDASDYLWYMTSLHLKGSDAVWSDNMTLSVNGSGHVLHLYVNGELLNSQWAKYGVSSNLLETPVKLRSGRNQISILSATIGFANYGARFDLVQSGIPGPVELIGYKGDERVIKDLSGHKWSYRVGLSGFESKLFNLDSKLATKWQEDSLPINSRLIWYKGTFKAPLGTNPVVLDLDGMGKGTAWVNGNNIGRYWPSFLAEEDGCSTETCDYRCPYDNNKCVSNCGKPTQRYYHVPRSFLKDDENTIVLFEEFGGNPSNINFQTLVVGSVCANAYEGNEVELSCNDRSISEVKFASFGDPEGVCGSFVKGTCEGANNTLDIITKECVGKNSCNVKISEEVFGSTKCENIPVRKLAVEALC